ELLHSEGSEQVAVQQEQEDRAAHHVGDCEHRVRKQGLGGHEGCLRRAARRADQYENGLLRVREARARSVDRIRRRDREGDLPFTAGRVREIDLGKLARGPYGPATSPW